MAKRASTEGASHLQAAIQRRHMAWIIALSEATGDPKSTIGERAGVSDTTISRIFQPDYSGTLQQLTIEKIKAHYGCTGPDEFAAGMALFSGIREQEATPYSAAEADDLRPLVQAMLTAHPRASVFRMRSRALELAGILPGDLLFVDEHIAPAPGDVVCAQVYDVGSGAAETVFRKFKPPRFLLAASVDPAFDEVLNADDRSVRIAGVVVAQARPWRMAGAA